MTDNTQISQLVAEVQAGRKYANISPDLIHRLAEASLQKGLKGKSAIKDVRNKLHQVGGAYFKQSPDYKRALTELAALPGGHPRRINPTILPLPNEPACLHCRTAADPRGIFSDLSGLHCACHQCIGPRLRPYATFHPLDAPRRKFHLFCLRYLH